ncbi:MAG: AAA family ATPase [Saprospiraceae bacterium]
MIITISGDIGSGKSTVSKLLVKQLDYKHLSIGGIQRQIAEEMNLTTLELNILSEKNTAIDDRIDAYTKALNDALENHIVDSRLAWHFIPSSFKIYLQCSTKEAARRISMDKSRSGEMREKNASVILNKILDRRASEKRRFMQKYGVNYTLLHQYDLVLDTTLIKPDFVLAEVLKHYDIWCNF